MVDGIARTFGHVGHFVLAHGLEGLPLELALVFGGNAEEVDCQGEDGEDAGCDGEELGCSHGEVL